MNDFPRISGLSACGCGALVIAALLTMTVLFTESGRSIVGAVTGVAYTKPALAACEPNEKLFPRGLSVPEGKTLVDAWAKFYHERVRVIVSEHLRQLQIGGICDESTRTKPTPALELLAKDLERDDPHQEDFPSLLLGYLEKYECALESESFVVEAQVEYVLAERKKEQGKELTISIVDLQKEIALERRRITQEFQTARRANHRLLVYLSGFGRFQPLNGALQCLVGATIDIRNILDLAAEASACLPRIWDAKTSLRTLSSP